MDGQRLEFVVVGRAGPVCVDVVYICRLKACRGEGHVHGIGQTFALGVGGSDMVGVAGCAVARKGGREGGREGGRRSGSRGLGRREGREGREGREASTYPASSA